MKNFYTKILVMTIILFPFFSYALFDSLNFFQKAEPKDAQIKLLFAGDIFVGRYMNKWSMASKTAQFAYPFSGLKTLERQNYDAWVGNLECPVTKEQSTLRDSEVYLKLSCRPEYLPELKKYFDIVSLANNHTDNINKRKGIEETRKNLSEQGLKYFGDYDNSQTNEVCKILYIKHDSSNIPFAFCGFHGVYKLPTDKELAIIKDYSKYFVTFVMPHQGEEYKFKSNTYQKLIYRKMIDNGADMVIGSHPHVIEEVETYKNKLIFYSLGNFIFDQSWSKTKEHMTVGTEINFPKYADNYANLDCESISNVDCLKKARDMKVVKPNFGIKVEPIFTSSGADNITHKTNLSDKEYNQKLKTIGFDKIASTSKIK